MSARTKLPISLALALALAGALAGCGGGSGPSGSTGSTGSSHKASGGVADTSATHAVTTMTAPATHTTALKPGGPEAVPLEQGPPLAAASTTAPGTTVDGIHCAPIEQLAYHIHAHLQVYVGGLPRSLPAAIGMIDPVYEKTPYGRFYGARGCYYWLHTHASDGIIHIESPTQRIYTLGEFFNEWRQPLSSTRVASAAGRVTAVVNGRRWTKSPRAIPLRPHATIELAVGEPIPPFHKVDWAATEL
jgi:hypothetical protein